MRVEMVVGGEGSNISNAGLPLESEMCELGRRIGYR
jgi:hypothetical protein